MISKIYLKFGRAPGSPPVSFETTPITIFLGPNNSGKSKVLQEIVHLCNGSHTQPPRYIIDSISFHSLSEKDAELWLAKSVKHVTQNTPLPEGYVNIKKGDGFVTVPQNQFLSWLTNPNKSSQQFGEFYLSRNILTLNGANRIALINPQSAGDLQQPSSSSFRKLFDDNDKRKNLRRVIFDAFGSYFVLDPTLLGHLRIKLSPKEPQSISEEKGIDDASVAFHKKSLDIEQTSDGVKAFTGLMTQIIAGDPRLLIIDEPEAFLHPALAFKLGKEISSASSDSDKRIFISTHSPHFLMGCIQSGQPVTIVRLTYKNDIPTARVLPANEILRLMRNPLLRSVGVMSGLFYDSVIVTESDTDRAFYEEINHRLLRFKPEFGIPNCLFLNAQNKQTVRTIISPLRELGIPTAGILDIDVLKDGGCVWTDLLSSLSLPSVEHQDLGGLRSKLLAKFEEIGREKMKKGGVDLLSASDREGAENLFDRLKMYGLFVVRRGELETWLTHLAIGGHGPDWLLKIFEKMGEDPLATNYLQPSDGDVWEFMSDIKSWLINAKRKGIPS